MMSELSKMVNRDRALDPIDLIPEFAFWRDGCRTFAKNVRKVIALSGEKVTDDSVLEFIRSLPRYKTYVATDVWQNSFCCRCLKNMCSKMTDQQIKEGVHKPLLDYFMGYFPDRTYVSQLMLIDAFVGLISGSAEAERELEKEGVKDGERTPAT